MNDLANVGRQFKLEAEAARLGAERLRERTQANEKREYSSGTIWGRKLIDQQVAGIAEQIKATEKKVRLGKAAPNATRIMDVVTQIEPEVLAAITAKKALDLIGQGQTTAGKYKNTYANVCAAIGAAVESEARFRWYQLKAPEQFQIVKQRYFKSTTGTRQKVNVAQVMMKRRGYDWKTWAQPHRFKVGAWLLNCLSSSVNWFVVENVSKGKQLTKLVRMGPELTQLKDTIMALAELHAPLTWPMLCQPADWGEKERGGYLTNQMRQQFSLIRTSKVVVTLKGTSLDMLNTLQSVPYCINRNIIQLMNDLHQRERSLGSFVITAHIDKPLRPETEDEEVLKQWRKRMVILYNREASLRGRCYRSLETLTTANRFKDEEAIWIPWSFDWRGRVYPIPTFMSPQGTDMEKALYLFAKPRPVTDGAKRWLAIHLANCAGKDKLAMDERVAWTEANVSLITAIATEPLSHLSQIESFDEPWCGYAACVEYYNCVITGTQTTTQLPVATDATCSGLQHLAAMTLDASTGRLVNVLPTDKPQDAYRAVLNETISLLRVNRPELADLAERVGRPLAKRVVMTVPYAAEERSNRGYIKGAVDEYQRQLPDSERIDITAEMLTVITKTMLTAMKTIVPGALAVMNWAKLAARESFKQEDREKIKWSSPSLFPVIQDKRHLNITRIKTHLLGDCVWTMVGDGFKGPAVGKHASGIMPNFIHSCDAALLHNSFAGFDQPFTLIHDSILTTATDMDYMSEVIRDEFVKMYEEKPLKMLAETLGVELPDELIIGTMDLKSCLQSTYFFC